MSLDGVKSIYEKYKNSFTGEFCMIPVKEFSFHSDYRILDLFRWQMELLFSAHKIDVKSIYDYNIENIIFYKVGKKMGIPLTWTIQIPYDSRSKYLATVKRLNQVVPLSGCITLFVDNNPYQLEAFLVIESLEKKNEIEQIIQDSSLKLTNSKGLPEFISEMTDRNWNMASFPPADDTAVEKAFQKLFLFAEKDALQAKGYCPERQMERPHLFISYSHADKETVSTIVAYMKSHGFNCWWDEQEIDIGDSIVERVHQGIQECTLAIVFLSHATESAMFAKHELRTFLQEKIYNQKDWFLVRLDDVNPDKIIEGLSAYKYFDYFGNNKQELAEAIQKKLQKL